MFLVPSIISEKSTVQGLTGVPHLPEYVCLQDLGNVAGDGPQQTPAGVATSGVPEPRAK